NNLVQEIMGVAPAMLPGQAREYLAKFLFSGDDVFKPVEVLSGGERGRLALAKLALRGANLLLLDEPTNHLDLPAQEVLQAVLAAYSGTILLVSHDRYLIDALATQVWEVIPEEGRLRVFAGTYSQYREVKEAEALERAREKPEAARVKRVPAPGAAKPGNTSRERRRQAQLKDLEGKISAGEAALAAVSRQLENPPADPGKVQKLGVEYLRLQNELEQLMGEWEALAAGAPAE
ncbi:MAG TPA: ATP-binding cassette domain-containing protein, partial [Anaerolineaceae bacterium]